MRMMALHCILLGFALVLAVVPSFEATPITFRMDCEFTVDLRIPSVPYDGEKVVATVHVTGKSPVQLLRRQAYYSRYAVLDEIIDENGNDLGGSEDEERDDLIYDVEASFSPFLLDVPETHTMDPLGSITQVVTHFDSQNKVKSCTVYHGENSVNFDPSASAGFGGSAVLTPAPA